MSSKIQYFSFGNTADGTSYASCVDSVVENMIETNDKDATITFPYSGWASLQSTSYRLTTEKVDAVLPFPIYKIKKICIYPAGATFGVGSPTTEATPYEDYKNAQGKHLEEIDITKYVVSFDEWQALPLSGDNSYMSGVYKDNTFYWERGDTTIPFIGTVYQKGPTVLGNLFGDATPVYIRLLKTALVEQGVDYKTGENAATSLAVAAYGSVNTDVRDWFFRVEYVPIISFKLKARKNADTIQDYALPFNQRAEINDIKSIGKNMYFTAQKTGTRCIIVAKNYKTLSDIPAIGALISHKGKRYRLVANDYKLTNTIFIQVAHTLSEDWTNRSNHISVDQKFRNWNIPQETLWRNLYYEDFAKLSFSRPTITDVYRRAISEDITRVFIHDVTTKYGDRPINYLFWTYINNEKEESCVVPCVTYVSGNSIVCSATFKDNYSAGFSRRRLKDDSWFCVDIPYCLEDGTVETAKIVLSHDMHSYVKDGGTSNEYGDKEATENAMLLYPMACIEKNYQSTNYVLNAPLQEMFAEAFYIDKDASEAIKFTYQIHFIAEDSRIIVCSSFLDNNTLVKVSERKNIDYKVILSKRFFREGETIINMLDKNYLNAVDVGVISEYDPNTGISTIGIDSTISANYEDIVAWAIVDSENKIYIACNNNEADKIYIWLSDKK